LRKNIGLLFPELTCLPLCALFPVANVKGCIHTLPSPLYIHMANPDVLVFTPLELMTMPLQSFKNNPSVQPNTTRYTKALLVNS